MTATALGPAAARPSPLVALLTRQRDLYRELKTLSDQQATLIEESQTDRLLSLLAQRQRLVDALTELNRELVPVRQALPQVSPPQREQVRLLMDEVDTLLQQIIEQDDRDRQNLQAAQRGVAAQIRQVRQGGAAAHAYRPAPQSASARFTDRQG